MTLPARKVDDDACGIQLGLACTGFNVPFLSMKSHNVDGQMEAYARLENVHDPRKKADDGLIGL